jgi:biopolymer transport protein ExbD
MSGSLMHESKVEPNLTPILDMVFQLITFFMLVINFKGAALDLTLQLPVLGSARPLDTQGQEGLLVLNIDHEGNLRSYGKVYSELRDIEAFIAGAADLDVKQLAKKGKAYQPGDELPTTVVIRADEQTPFTKLNAVITACQQQGYLKFSLRAMNRIEEG